jgi:hypothetical protein
MCWAAPAISFCDFASDARDRLAQRISGCVCCRGFPLKAARLQGRVRRLMLPSYESLVRGL